MTITLDSISITLDSIRNVMKKRSYTALSPKKRLAHQDQMSSEMQLSSPIHQNIQDKKDKERSAEWRKTFRQAIAGQDKSKPKRKPRQSTPKKESEKKQTKGQGETYPSYASSVAAVRSSNRRTNRTYSGRGSSSVGADPYGQLARAAGKESTQAKRAVYKKPKAKKTVGLSKSLDELNEFISGMIQGINKDKIGTSLNEWKRADNKKDRESYGKNNRKLRSIRSGQEDKNVQQGMSYLTNIKQSLNDNFNALLDAYQNRWYNKAKDFMGNETGKVTESAYGKGKPRAGDVSKKPKAIGESKEDQKVMQS